ncbi:uncharacterized protein [Antedon mediterranea]|uniref:uncharacterized protein n=1 Tax=Antedon mediterranea TaxID=105859 RepID=UPI003AF4D95E
MASNIDGTIPECAERQLDEAFKEYKEKLKNNSINNNDQRIQQIENVIREASSNAKKLEENKEASLKDIDNQVKEMVQLIKKKGDEKKKEVNKIYEKQKEVNDKQMKHFKETISQSNLKLNQCFDLFCTSEEFKQYDRKINFVRSKYVRNFLEGENSFGNVTWTFTTLRLNQQAYGVAKCDDDYLLVSFHTNEIYKYNHSGNHVDTILTKQETQVDKMQQMTNGRIAFIDVGYTCIHVCNATGAVIKTIGEGVLQEPHGFHIDESNNVIYVADGGNGCVMFDLDSGKDLKFISYNEKHAYSDVALTKTGKLLVADTLQNEVSLYEDKDKSLKVLINKGDEDGKVWHPHKIVVDEEGNIIIASVGKLQLFSSDGGFLKRINKQEDEISFCRNTVKAK